MKQTRHSKHKNLKRLCIFVSQEKKDDTVETTIDYVGDEELLKEYERSIAMRAMEKLYKQ